MGREPGRSSTGPGAAPAILAATVVLLAGWGGASAGRDRSPPSAPSIQGPRTTSQSSPIYRFRSIDRDDPTPSLRYRCAFDSLRLHGCASRYTQRLTAGRHLLRAQALDRAGNRSRVTAITVAITAALPPAGKVVATIATGSGCCDLDLGEGSVWGLLDKKVVRIDPATNTVSASIAVPLAANEGQLAVGDGGVWVTNGPADTVLRIDPQTNAVVATIAVGSLPEGIATTPGAVWVANHHSDSVSKIDPATNKVVATTSLGTDATGGPAFVAAGADSVWVDVPNLASVVRIDPATTTVAAKISAPPACGAVAAVGNDTWVASGCSPGTFSRIDVNAGKVVAIVKTDADAFDVAIGLGSVWATTSRALLRIDPATNAVVGASPGIGGAAIGSGVIWAADGSHVLRLAPG